MLGDEQRIVLPSEPNGCRISWFVYVIRLQDEFSGEDRDMILAYLREHGIGCNNYFTPIHLQPFIADKFGCRVGDFPVTERIAQRTIALPFYNNLSREQVETACAALKFALNRLI
jgi:perosamine synthetase